jgi:hypothetical protein
MGLNAETVERPHEDQVQFTICQERTCAHAVSEAVCENWRIGLFEPALWSELLGVGPYIGVYGFVRLVVKGEMCVGSSLPILHAHAFRKKTVPLGMTTPS